MPEADALDLLTEIAGVQPWLAPAVSELQGLALERWQAEHTRLFINGHPKTPCPPFESAYRHGHMNGSSVGELEDLYARAGLESLSAGADFLGVLLEFAAHLEEQGSGGVLAQALWQDHLARWVPRFAGDLERNAHLRLYRDLGARLQALFADEPETAGTEAADA
jgi:TorA maturation chaperone TorD